MATVIWRFSDGNTGHDRQSAGLVAALAERLAVSAHELAVRPGYRVLGDWLSGRYRPGSTLPAPDLLIGAGHATHLHLLAARRSHGGRSVVLMKPSLPSAWFDLCLVPAHDAATPAPNLLTTRGVLNDIRPATAHDSDTGLIVIGGPSRHVRWNTAAVLAQVEQLQRQRPKSRWWLSTSRRTPEALVARLRGRAERVFCSAWTTPDWLPARLAEADEVWVTRDSVSMIYEALSAGARVGLLDVPPRGRNRITVAVDRLIDEGWVTAPGHWRTLAPGPGTPLNEAARCADWMVRQWLTLN